MDTSFGMGGMKIFSTGKYHLHPLVGVNQEQSIKSTSHILSIPIAPAFNQNLQLILVVWRLDIML